MRRLSILALFLLLQAIGTSAQDAPPTVELIARLGRGWVQTAAWSADGSHLAVAGSIGVWVYDATDWDIEPVLLETDYRTTWAEFSPGGGLLAVGLADGTAQAFDVVTGKFLDRIVGGPVPERGAMANFNVAARQANFVPATTAPGRTPQGAVGELVLNDNDGTELRLQVLIFGDNLPESQLVSPDGTITVVHTRDTITLVDAAGEPVHDLPGYSLPILDIAFSPLHPALLVRQLGSTIRVYDAVTAADLGVYPTAWEERDLLLTAIDPNSRRAAIVIASSGIQIIDPVLGPVTLSGRDDTVRSLAFEPGGARLAVGFADGTLRVYDELDDSHFRDAYAHFGHTLDIVWLPESGYLVTAGEEGRVKLWLADRAVLGDAETFGGHADEVTSLAVSPTDPSLFASASLDGTVKLWRLRK
jgi:WD40 repeat protein